MRAAATFLFFILLPLAAMAQTVTNRVCNTLPLSADVPPPASPSVAAGMVAARNRDFALARANFRPLAENGDADAQRAMGQLLMQDCTGLQDETAAVGWLTKAAAAGSIQAEVLLGRAYMRGLGVPQDDARAFALFSHAAANADPVAQMEVGYLYSAGRGVPRDSYQGLQWTVKAAEQDNGVALGNIAAAYSKGEVLERDVDRAAYFLALANLRASPVQRNDMVGISRQIRATVSIEELDRQAKRAQRWTPGPGSLSDVLSDAEDFRRHHN